MEDVVVESRELPERRAFDVPWTPRLVASLLHPPPFERWCCVLEHENDLQNFVYATLGSILG